MRTLPFSDLVREQTAVFPLLQGADVLLERRDAENVVLMRDERYQAVDNPRRVDNSSRQQRLHGDLASVRLDDGKELGQWQYEVTAAGRIWSLIDDDVRTLWVTRADVGHPGITDKNKDGRRIR